MYQKFVRTPMRMIVVLASLAMVAVTGSSPAEAAVSSRITANVEYDVGYMGCTYKIQHGQYGSSGFANINYVGGSCNLLSSLVQTNQGSSGAKYAPIPGGVTAAKAGTEQLASFIIQSTKYGLKCTLQIQVNADGTYSISTFYVSGYGTCPTAPGWISRA